jgi:outer membrane protein OmpA-like peptidoglycan-associated protein
MMGIRVMGLRVMEDRVVADRVTGIRSPGVWTLAWVAAVTMLVGCTTDPYTGEKKISKTAIGGVLGAAAGAGIGAMANSRNRAKGALIGAGIGTVAGGGVGAYMDYQESKLRKQMEGTGVSVTRVGDEIVLNMPGNVTFAHDSAELRADFYKVLNGVSLVLKEYEKTIIEITGHTDSTGSQDYNLALSRRRAQSVGNYLSGQGILVDRIITEGFGKQYPVADNGTPEGRQANRRVELRLVPLTA